MDSVEDHLVFKEKQCEEIIRKVFAEETNKAPRYNPFFLLKDVPELQKAIDRDYEDSLSVKAIIESSHAITD